MKAILPEPPRRKPPGAPEFSTLEAGKVLRRVHGGDAADSFNPTPQPSRLRGGRFDSLIGDYSYAYLGDSDEAAIAETLCRDLPLGGAARLVPRARVLGRRVTSVRIERDLQVLQLRGAALTQVGAPLMLTKSDADHYEVCRRWAAHLRGWFPDVAGFEYRPRHDEDRLSWVLFDDGPPPEPPRARQALSKLADTMSLEDGPGLATLQSVLRQHNASLS